MPGGTDSVEAYDLFLRGRANYYRYTREHLLAAINCFEEAIKIDANFANAYGYLSFCYFQGFNQLLPGFDDGLDRAHELAEKGEALDGTSAIALTRLGWIQSYLRRYDQAITNLEKALALAPDNAEVYATFGNVLNYWGDPERGLEMLEKFLHTLESLADKPTAICFYTEGVKALAKGSPLELGLKLLDSEGVRLLDVDGALIGSYERPPEVREPAEGGTLEIRWSEPFPTDQEGAVTIEVEYTVGVVEAVPVSLTFDLTDVPIGE